MAAERQSIIENLELQLYEIEMLSSMFPGENEFTIDDKSVLADVQAFTRGVLKRQPRQLSFTLRLCVDELSESVELVCNMPPKYPTVMPSVFVRCAALPKESQKDLNNDLKGYLSTLERGELCNMSAIQWIQENVPLYIKKNQESRKNDFVDEPTKTENANFSRLWLYFHHIYNKTKRKDILEWSSDFDLTGFSLPGKPGIVCVEGLERNVEEYFAKLRKLPWKKITCRHKENGEAGMTVTEQRKFKTFEELNLNVQTHHKEHHMDMGVFYKYLEQHDLHNVFSILFGVEGKTGRE